MMPTFEVRDTEHVQTSSLAGARSPAEAQEAQP
jgi:hypothetical protein